jgi:hypothetical protein
MNIFLANTGLEDWNKGSRHIRERGAVNIYLACMEGSGNTGMSGRLKEGASLVGPRYKELHILCSYHYFKNKNLTDLRKQLCIPTEVFVDSGAFSAATLGEVIDIQKYAEYLNTYRDQISVMATLDDLSSPEASWRNWVWLRDQGLPVIPCFHVGEDWIWLSRYLEASDYVALGGMVPHMLHRKQHVKRWVLECFKRLPEGKGYHGFGCTSWDMICDFPWRSVDSSSWTSGFRFGQLSIFDKASGSWKSIQLGDTKSCTTMSGLIARYGLDYRDFSDRNRNTRQKNCGIAMESWLLAEEYVSRKFGRGKIFLANDKLSDWQLGVSHVRKT